MGRTTRSIDIRILQHRLKTSSAAKWTRLYPAVRLIPNLLPNLVSHKVNECMLTLATMDRYGIDNVRGGPYCQVHFSTGQRKHLEHVLRSIRDECYGCGQKGHLWTHCPTRPRGRNPSETGPHLSKLFHTAVSNSITSY